MSIELFAFIYYVVLGVTGITVFTIIDKRRKDKDE